MKTHVNRSLPAYNEEQMIEKNGRDNRPADGE